MEDKPTIMDLVEALKAEYPYLERDVEFIELGDKLRLEMFEILRRPVTAKNKVIGTDPEGKEIFSMDIVVPEEEIDNVRKKMQLLGDSKTLTETLREVVMKLPPADETTGFVEPGSALIKFKERQKEKL